MTQPDQLLSTALAIAAARPCGAERPVISCGMVETPPGGGQNGWLGPGACFCDNTAVPVSACGRVFVSQ